MNNKSDSHSNHCFFLPPQLRLVRRKSRLAILSQIQFLSAFSFIYGVLLCSTSLGGPANEIPPSSFNSGSIGASINSEYFTTKANYESSRGAYTRLPGDSNLTHTEVRMRGRYTFTRKFSLFAGSSFSHVQAVDLVHTKTNSQITEGLGGINYLFATKLALFIPEILVSVPVDRTSANQITPMTNDGVTYVKSGIFILKPFRRFRLCSFLGLHYPMDSLAKKFLYEATLDMRVFDTFTIGGGVDGYEPAMSDEKTLINRMASATRANAGSERFYSYNPSLIEARGWIGWRPDTSLWIRAGYAKTLNGLHTAEGQSFLLSVQFNSSHVDFSSDASRTSSRKGSDPDSALKTFEVDIEDTDQSVFQPDDGEIKNTKRGRESLDATEKMLEQKSKDK